MRSEPDTAEASTLDIAWDDLPRETLEAIYDAALEVENCMRVLHKNGDNLVGELLKDEGTFYEWQHYPKGDVYDQETHSQYYYHAHPDRDREHGHFHTFLRPRGMPRGIRPAAVPGFRPPEKPENALSHLIGISMDRYGIPVSLFTTNRWVTGEVWYHGDDVIRMLDFFEIDHARPSWPVNRWIGGMLRMFRPQIVELIKLRDTKVAEWRRRHRGRDIFEDRNLEVISETPISLQAQLSSVRDRLRQFPA